MVALEYNKVKIAVPENWDDITVGHYESFYQQKPETARERVAMVAHICQVNADLLLDWPAEVFNRIVGHIGFLFRDNPYAPDPSLVVDKVTYIVPIEDELSLGAWVDAEEVQKSGVNVISGMLSIVCRPVGEKYDYKNNEARAAMFASLPVSRVLPVLAFFLHCKDVYEKRIEAYTKLAALAGQLPRNIGTLLRHGGGIKLSQIWPVLKYCSLMLLLNYRLRKFSTSLSTAKRKRKRTGPSAS